MKSSSDASRGELGGVAGAFPRHAHVVYQASGQAQLGVGGDDEPSPAICLLGHLQRGSGPAEGVLDEAVGVLEVEAVEVGGQAQLQVGCAGP